MLDPRKVKEVILVIISEIALHLRRVHAAKRLGHIDRRNPQRRENITRHLSQGQHGAQNEANDGHHDRERAAQGCSDKIHAVKS